MLKPRWVNIWVSISHVWLVCFISFEVFSLKNALVLILFMGFLHDLVTYETLLLCLWEGWPRTGPLQLAINSNRIKTKKSIKWTGSKNFPVSWLTENHLFSSNVTFFSKKLSNITYTQFSLIKLFLDHFPNRLQLN